MNTQKDIKLFLKTAWPTTVLPDRWHCWTSCSDSQISPCIQVALVVRHCKNKEVCMHTLYTHMWEMTSCERNMAGTSWFIAVQSLACSLDSVKLPVNSFLQEAAMALADDRIYGVIIIGAVHSCKTTNGKRALVGIETHENWLSISNPAQ